MRVLRNARYIRQGSIASLQPEGEIIGVAACVPIGIASKLNGAAQVIAAEREAGDAGDGYAYWIVERATAIGLPSLK